MSGAYYNEIDPYAAQWLRNLIAAGHIPAGDVDERSIADVHPIDLVGYTQCHFFAGLGGWAYAARLAGWPDNKPLWTGSCPCQPFSAAGKRKGTADERHLWPEMRRLIAACRPVVVAGEQVASKDGRVWLAGVRTDLEDMAYGVWAADLCAAGVSAPHIRQRIWWLADTDSVVVQGQSPTGQQSFDESDNGIGRMANANGSLGQQGCTVDGGWNSRSDALEGSGSGGGGVFSGLGFTDSTRRESGQSTTETTRHRDSAISAGSTGVAQPARLGNTDEPRSQGWGERLIKCPHQWPPGTPNFAVLCTDGKARRFEPGSFPLAHGVSARVGRLRAYGNAINPWIAAEILGAYLDGP
ncbi:MAG: DNA cytosine methyltransferase [Alphaproteobacteria bacterium]|nr:DNA cytosine methyltransferase [Alphaproteobacteria bacterium]